MKTELVLDSELLRYQKGHFLLKNRLDTKMLRLHVSVSS